MGRAQYMLTRHVIELHAEWGKNAYHMLPLDSWVAYMKTKGFTFSMMITSGA